MRATLPSNLPSSPSICCPLQMITFLLARRGLRASLSPCHIKAHTPEPLHRAPGGDLGCMALPASDMRTHSGMGAQQHTHKHPLASTGGGGGAWVHTYPRWKYRAWRDGLAVNTHLHMCSLTWIVPMLKLCPSCPLAFFLFRYCTITSYIHTHREALQHSPRHWQDTWWTHPQWFIITHFRAMPLQRRKLNKQAMLSVTRWPSSSSRSCLSGTIDCTTDILDLNGGRKKRSS